MSLFTLLGKIKLDGAKEVHADLEKTDQHVQKTGRSLVNLHNVMSGVENVAKAMGKASSVAFGAVTAGATAAGVAALNAYTSYESLTRGLATTTRNAQELLAVQSKIREIAKLPGLGESEAGQAYLTLRSAGLSADLSARSITSFGNALASVGKGKAELDGVITALSQIQSKGVVSAEEINQIAERVPQIRRLLKEAFGTADTQQIQALGLSSAEAIGKIVAAAEKLPQASGGIRNMMENLADALERGQRPLGQGIAIAFQAAEPFVNRVLAGIERTSIAVGEVFAALGQSGVLGEALSNLSVGIEGLDGWITQLLANVLSFVKNFPTIMADAGKYAESLWGAVTANMQIFFRNSLAKIKAYFADTFRGIKADAMETIGNLILMIPHMPGIKSGVSTAGQGFLDEAKRLRGMSSTPTLEAYKDLPDFSKNFSPFRDADSYADRITNARRRLPSLPDNLSFGGPEEAAQKGNATANKALESLLAQIEKNTAKTANVLEDRKVSGGADIARMGITGAEMSMMGNPGPDPYTRSINATLEDAIRRVQIQTNQRTSRRNLALYGRG
jgi:tape measure domain-containing protein